MTAMPVNLNGRDQYTLSSLHLKLRYKTPMVGDTTVISITEYESQGKSMMH